MNTIDYLVSIADQIDYVGVLLEELDIKSGCMLTAEQKLIVLMDDICTSKDTRFVVAPAVVADELLISFYDRLTSKLATRMSADRVIEEYHKHQIELDKNQQ